MEVNGAGPALAGTVTFTGIGSIALLGSVFIFWNFEFQKEHETQDTTEVLGS